jgi:hypothetical protein
MSPSPCDPVALTLDHDEVFLCGPRMASVMRPYVTRMREKRTTAKISRTSTSAVSLKSVPNLIGLVARDMKSRVLMLAKDTSGDEREGINLSVVAAD